MSYKSIKGVGDTLIAIGTKSIRLFVKCEDIRVRYTIIYNV